MKLLTALLLIGCASGYTEYAKAPSYPKLVEYCIDGVVYLADGYKTSSFFSVKWNKDSEVVTCKGEGKINEW